MTETFQATLAAPDAHDERRFVLHGVPWWIYVALRDALDDQSGLKMTYLEGILELMSPSTMHEDAKKILPELDLALLLRFVQLGKNQTQLLKAYQAALRAV